MVAPGAPRQPQDGAPGVHIPVRRAQPGERGHHIHARAVFHFICEILAVGALVDELQLVPQPLDDRPAHEHTALQRIGRLPVQADGHGGEQAVFALHRCVPCVHQHKAARAVCIFHIAPRKACLAEQGGLLVARRARDGYFGPADARRTVHHAGIANFGQHAHGNVEQRTDILVPFQRMDVEQHRARGVGDVRHMGRAARQLPDEPGVHGAE